MISLIRLSVFSLLLTAQLTHASNGISPESEKKERSSESPGLKYKNVVKVSLTSLAFKGLTAQYERALGKRISVALSYRGIPGQNLVLVDRFERSFEKHFDYDQADFENIRNMELTSNVITPEIRIYTGSKGTRGFYLAPYASFASHRIKTPAFIFEKTEDDESTSTISLPMNGSVRGISGGLMLGAQFNLGSRITLDWWIIGASFGKANGTVEALSVVPLSEDWQEEVSYALENFELPYVKYETQVNSQGATLKVDGPWAGIRGGLSLGLRF